jgi:hypothetical protein
VPCFCDGPIHRMASGWNVTISSRPRYVNRSSNASA